jgi:hypothetical protein
MIINAGSEGRGRIASTGETVSATTEPKTEAKVEENQRNGACKP